MSVLKWKVNFPSNFALLFIVMTHNSSVSFKFIPFLFWTKGSHKSSNFDTFKCYGENLPNFKSLFSNHWSVFLQNFHNSSVSWKITPLYFCSSNNIYFDHKEPIKTKKILDFISAWVKICEVHVNFKTTSQFLLTFCVTLHCHDTQLHCKFEAHTFSTLDKKILSKFQFWHLQLLCGKFAKFLMSFSKHNKPVIIQILHHSSVSRNNIPLYFFSSNNIYFAQKELIKMKIFETFKCPGQILSNSLCQFWNDKSIPLQILYPSSVSWKITPRYSFSSNNIYFAQKELIKMTIFETFKCSSQILSNSLCQFWNDKSIPLQILYPSSVSWKITPRYSFSSNNIYFAQKELIKMTIFETFKCSSQILSNSLCQFWNDKSIPLQILYPSSVSWKITPRYSFSSNNIYFAQKELIKMTIFET